MKRWSDETMMLFFKRVIPVVATSGLGGSGFELDMALISTYFSFPLTRFVSLRFLLSNLSYEVG